MITKEKETEAKKIDSGNIEDVINYYNTCWLNRFADGHNPKSYAMHFGIFREGNTDNDIAKIETNIFLATLLNIPQDKITNLADFGCGVGGTCVFLAEHYPHISVFGINVSQEQIHFARRVAASKQLKGKTEFLLCDYRDTTLERNSMHYVIAVESLWHAENKIAVFAEAFRVLRENGYFAFIDYFQTRAAQTEEEQKLLTEFNNGWGAYIEGTGPVKSFSEDYEAELKQTGFGIVKSESILPLVLRGIENSYEKALKKLRDGLTNVDLIKHYKACVALKILVDKAIIDYRVVIAEK